MFADSKHSGNGRPAYGYLFWFLSIWTTVQLTFFILVFFRVDSLFIPPEMPIAYFLLLVAYAMHKEIDRWVWKYQRNRRGDIFIVGWFAVLLVMFVIVFVTNGKYEIPDELVETCVYIVAPYVLTGVSKVLFNMHHPNGNTKKSTS